MKTNKSQSDQILEYLQKGYVLTPLDALKRFGCFRLSARVFDLKKRGHNIIKIDIYDNKTGKKYAAYMFSGFVEEKKQSFIQKLFKRC